METWEDISLTLGLVSTGLFGVPEHADEGGKVK